MATFFLFIKNRKKFNKRIRNLISNLNYNSKQSTSPQPNSKQSTFEDSYNEQSNSQQSNSEQSNSEQSNSEKSIKKNFLFRSIRRHRKLDVPSQLGHQSKRNKGKFKNFEYGKKKISYLN